MGESQIIWDDGRMSSTPPLAPRSPYPGIIAVWVAALVIGIAVGIFVPRDMLAGSLCVGLGVCLVTAFGIQIWYGRAQGFIVRVSASVVGALVVLGVISAGFGLAALGG